MGLQPSATISLVLFLCAGRFASQTSVHLTAKRDHIFATPKSPLPDECTAQSHRINSLKAASDRQAMPREPRSGGLTSTIFLRAPPPPPLHLERRPPPVQHAPPPPVQYAPPPPQPTKRAARAARPRRAAPGLAANRRGAGRNYAARERTAAALVRWCSWSDWRNGSASGFQS